MANNNYPARKFPASGGTTTAGRSSSPATAKGPKMPKVFRNVSKKDGTEYLKFSVTEELIAALQVGHSILLYPSKFYNPEDQRSAQYNVIVSEPRARN